MIVAPKIRTHAPEIMTRTPEIMTRVPKIMTRVPKIMTRAPKIMTRVPKIMTRAPKIMTRAPKIMTRVPKIMTRAPKIMTRVPKIMTRAPKIRTLAPEIRTPVPEIRTPVPEIRTPLPNRKRQRPGGSGCERGCSPTRPVPAAPGRCPTRPGAAASGSVGHASKPLPLPAPSADPERTAMTDPVDVRERLLDVLRLDLVGPEPGSLHERETLVTKSPSTWYLTGFLVPYEAPESVRHDEEAEDDMDAGGDGEGTDDAGTPEAASGRKVFFPSSIGMSVLVGPETRELEITATWGDYRPEKAAPGEREEEGDGRVVKWHREPRRVTKRVVIARTRERAVRQRIDDSEIFVATSVRPVPKGTRGVPKGARAVSIFLVNHRDLAPDVTRDEAFLFQAALAVRCDEGFVPRPNLRGRTSEDFDERIAELQHRDVHELAVGHGVATRALRDDDGRCRSIETVWMPGAEVEKVVPGLVSGAKLEMEALADAPSAEALRGMLEGLPAAYTDWIARQAAPPGLDADQKKALDQLVKEMENACARMTRGIEALADDTVRRAFQLANRVMADAARQRQLQAGKARDADGPPAWRPFQLAFLLMNLRGIAEPSSKERNIVDLLFFPTGGGKTEAYLGLAAFTLVHRRLTHPGLASAGLAVLMRYTLRLLTLDQLGRAATLICALELRREQEKLGPWPFEIGLWVGEGATPNRMGKKGDGNDRSARSRTLAFLRDSSKPSPIPLENCPWCGTKFGPRSFRLTPDDVHPQNLEIRCAQRGCAFAGERALPIVGVDEPIYRRLPCFLIATVDKFAQLPWVGPTGALFGKVDRYDKAGFYGPCNPGVGAKLSEPLLPPDLVIQDELHLISGPLGTMVGLYETALDALSERKTAEGSVRPKIIASTATVRRAEAQIQALFCRTSMAVFPPPGPDRRDSFFARTVPVPPSPAERSSKEHAHARRYVGVAAQGRSLKVVLLRTYLALLSAGQRIYEEEGGAGRAPNNPADPYMTLLGYFNSLGCRSCPASLIARET